MKTLKDISKETRLILKDILLNERFTIERIERYTMYILVEKQFKLQIWISNGAYSCDLYGEKLYEDLLNRKEQAKLWKLIKPKILKHKKEVRLKQLRNEIKEIENKVLK